jgi:hypothetical protein
MAISTITYAPPVRRSTRPANIDYEQFEAAVALSDEGRFAEALGKVLAHLFPTAEIPDLAAAPFSFAQGSSRVSIQVDGGELVVSVPLVALPAGGTAIAALRFVLTKMSSTGQLHQPRLRGDAIHLEFRDKVTRMHPAKVLEVVRRIAQAADYNDDLLIGQFQATALDRAPIEPLDDDEQRRAVEIWQSHWHDVEELTHEAQRKRSVWFLNELTAYAQHNIKFKLPIQGYLTTRLGEASSMYNDTDVDPSKREAMLVKHIKEMKAVTADELKRDLGHATYALSPLSDGTAQTISEYFGPGHYMETIDKLRKTGSPMDAALALIGTHTYLLARYAWPEEVETALQHGLEQASGKPWRDAAAALFEHAEHLVATFVEDDEEGGGEDEEEEDEDESEEEAS